MRVLKKSLWPHCVVIDKPSDTLNLTEMEIWLGNQFKTYYKRWYIVQGFRHTEFYFKTEKDAHWFAMRWL